MTSIETSADHDEPKDLTLFEHIMQIATLHEQAGGKPEAVFELAKSHVDFVCKKLKLTPIQAVLFADLFCDYEGDTVPLRKLAETIQCKTVEMYKYLDDFDVLERKNLILCRQPSRRSSRSGGMMFEIPLETLGDLQVGKRPKNLWTEKLTADEFFNRAEKLCDERLADKENYDQTIKKFGLLTECNRHVPIVRTLASFGLSKDDELLLLRFCLHDINADEEEMDILSIEAFYQHRVEFRKSRFELKAGKHILQQKNLITFSNHGGFAQHELYRLTKTAKEKLLGNRTETSDKNSIRDLIDSTTIVKKNLFYPEKTTRSVQELTGLLQKENWNRIRKNLHEKGMRTGFACLFSGKPGTGKTETALQIARITSRAIMQVDISETKSMWFGESEKRIKAVFNRYRSAARRTEVTPILLFNEADAVIGKRLELGESRHGPGQTENTIQNIILQEMENLDGILIATTNLSVNMDKAFERRFLYKIEFEQPTPQARKSIWQTTLPDLPNETAVTLATRFGFSGGQIENIARRSAVAQVLHGRSPNLEELILFCQDEEGICDNVKRIGFTVQECPTHKSE